MAQEDQYRRINALLQRKSDPNWQGEISSYVPSALDQAAQWANSTFYGDDREGFQKAKKIENVVGYSPAVSALAPFYLKDTITRGLEGKPEEAAMAGLNGLLSTAAAPQAISAMVKAAPGLVKNARALHADERGTFGGKLADKFPKEMVPLADSMWDTGHSMEEIYDFTGLMPTSHTRKYLDQGLKREEITRPEWQFEIDDSGAKFSSLPKEVSSETDGINRLGNFMDHPELYKNYPELENLPIRLIPGKGGSYNPQRNWDELQDPMEIGIDNAPEVTFHEVTHAVQNIEGFAGGASTRYLNSSGERLLEEKISEKIKQFTPRELAEKRGLSFSELTKEQISQLELDTSKRNEMADQFNAMGKNVLRQKLYQDTANEAYLRSAGEVEANNVMERYARRKDIAQLEKAAASGEDVYDPELDMTFSPSDARDYLPQEKAQLRYPWQTEAVDARNQLLDQELYRGRRPDFARNGNGFERTNNDEMVNEIPTSRESNALLSGTKPFVIMDSHTGKIVGEAGTRARASNSVDKRDNAYGGYRFMALPRDRLDSWMKNWKPPGPRQTSD